MFDRILAHYGPEAKDARDELGRTIAKTVALTWPKDNTSGTGVKAAEGSAGPEWPRRSSNCRPKQNLNA
jgi:hypothetical protein